MSTEKKQDIRDLLKHAIDKCEKRAKENTADHPSDYYPHLCGMLEGMIECLPDSDALRDHLDFHYGSGKMKNIFS